MGGVLGIVIRAIGSHLIQQAGLTRARAQTGAVTLIQRFGGALNLNVHYHILFLDGVYVTNTRKRPHFVPVPAPTVTDLQTLIERISERVGRHLERRGLLVRDAENAYLEWDGDEASPMDDLVGHAITYRIAVGPNRGQKAFTLQTLPAREAGPTESDSVACAAGFSLHAGVAARAYQRGKLERLCRYVTRPAVAEPRLSVTAGGHIRYSLAAPAHPCARGIRASLHSKDSLAGRYHARPF